MQTFVGLVRGINVGPTTKVSMADLRKTFEASGYENVETLLQSGNVVFDSPQPLPADAVVGLEREFTARTGITGRFVLLAAAEFTAILDENPLLDIADDPSRLVIGFVSEAPDVDCLSLIDAPALRPEVLAFGRNAVYSWSPLGVAKSRVPAAFWRRVAPTVTARNLNTVTKIAAVLEARIEGVVGGPA
jgi:uncharacterized protein (DUF1697 family)